MGQDAGREFAIFRIDHPEIGEEQVCLGEVVQHPRGG